MANISYFVLTKNKRTILLCTVRRVMKNSTFISMQKKKDFSSFSTRTYVKLATF